MKKKYIITVINPTAYREYETSSRSAMRAAKQFGRCEGGERVTVWTPENDGKYIRVQI